MQEYFNLLQQNFFEDDTCSLRPHFEKLMMSQISLLKAYNNTPIERYNFEAETLYPVTLSILILKMIFVVNDALPDKKGADQPKPNLRKKFMQADGLKNLFGVRIVDNYCLNPDDFAKAEISSFMLEQLKNGTNGSLMVDNFVGVLINNRASMVQAYENYIRQLMFIQYKQNCKRESKKDIAEWYKPVFDAVDSNGGNSATLQSPKASKKQGKATSQSMKKGKSSDKKPQAVEMSKHQSKQLKILMKKNESYNEVPLKQFVEFFLRSQVSMQIDYFEYFLLACKNICVIDVVDNEVIEGTTTKTQQVTTIKLRNSVLKEMILESRNDPLSQGEHLHPSSWQAEYKKRIGDFQPQNEAIHQLLDIFISQIKGPKMNILKCLKNNRLEHDSDFKLALRDNKLYLSKEEGDAGLQMSKYLFDSSSILQVIGNELIQNPVLIGSVLKHKDQKTFKYIVRNILPLRYLQLVGNDRQVVF